MSDGVSPAALFAEDLIERIAARVAEQLVGQLAVQAEPSPWMTADEAAEYVRCRPKRIYDLVSQRRIPAHRDGTRLLLHRDELDEYLSGDDTCWHPAETALHAGHNGQPQRTSDSQVKSGAARRRKV